MRRTLAFLFFCCLAAPQYAAGAALPDMHEQDAWTGKEKQQFLDFLKSGQPSPALSGGGQVKYVAPEKGWRSAPSKARYASLSFVTDTLMIQNPGGSTRTETVTVGPRIMAGGHLFSWVRYYAGLKYTRIGQDKLDGGRAQLSHWEVPAGLELALIPLGTPQTRYVLLRGGVSYHDFAGDAKKSDFRAPLLGGRTAWNVGIGYEWQIPDSKWRVNTLLEGYRSFGCGRTQFSGLGLNAGVVRTF